MTPKKQVSPAIRILQGERDASARATHLEAATRKFLVTTNERKQMSTKTNFKRIALVAVAALGMGVLSSVPSQALFSGTAGVSLTITVANGTGALDGSPSDTTTAGTVSVTGLALAASDSYSVTSTKKSWPATTTGAKAPTLFFQFIDTATSNGPVTVRKPSAGTTELSTATLTDSSTIMSANATAANQYVASKWYAFQDSSTANGAQTIERVAGTYVYTIIVTPLSGTAQTVDLTITISALASSSLVASSAFSTLYIGDSGATADAAVTGLATASDTPKGYLNVVLKNASNDTSAKESVTVTTTLGTVGDGSSVRGRSVVLKYNSTSAAFPIYSDGTAGTGTVTVSTPSVTFATKTVTFYSAAAKTITATVAHPVLKIGTNAGSVRGVAVDANGVAWSGTAYIVASSAADALIAGSVTPVSCGTYDSTNARFNCPVTAIGLGTAKFKIIDAATVALATATSNEVTVTVSGNPVATVKLSFDKATYAPNERARIYVTALDSAGKELATATYANLLASGGISINAGVTFGGQGTTQADSLTATSITTSASSSSATGAKAGAALYTLFMPAAGGTVTITATGGTSLPLAGQVAVTASATVTDSGAAALAAVTALATTVASLKTLITTLTNLVLKIQKKVKA